MAESIIIRTSDRVVYKRCRRKWNWSSHLRNNLMINESIPALWVGSGVHWALEDFHGYNIYKHPATAFKAYVKATINNKHTEVPPDWREWARLSIGMMHYYMLWLKTRNPIQTYIRNGVPQVEVVSRVQLPLKGPNGEDVFYQVIFDRVGIDEQGRLWILEYKTAKRIVSGHFLTDPQVNSYCYMARHEYPDMPIEGVMYQQHRKDLPDVPRLLTTGKISTNKTMATTRALYRVALQKMYGDVGLAPKANIDFLNHLADAEDVDRDNFIQRDRIYKNEYTVEAERQKIMMEVPEMLDPNLPLYPNPTRACSSECDFYSPCISLDDGGDWEHEIQTITKQRAAENSPWKDNLPDYDEAIQTLPNVTEADIHYDELNISREEDSHSDDYAF